MDNLNNPLKGKKIEMQNPVRKEDMIKGKNKGNLPYLQARRKLRYDLFRK